MDTHLPPTPAHIDITLIEIVPKILLFARIGSFIEIVLPRSSRKRVFVLIRSYSLVPDGSSLSSRSCRKRSYSLVSGRSSRSCCRDRIGYLYSFLFARIRSYRSRSYRIRLFVFIRSYSLVPESLVSDTFIRSHRIRLFARIGSCIELIF
jgi:hypothetical protein